MNRSDVLKLLQSAKNEDLYAKVRDELRKMDEKELFFGLFTIAIRPSSLNPKIPNYSAGNLLFDLNPTCQISCIEAIEAMLEGWDISLGDLPFYIYKQYNMATIQDAIFQLDSKPLSKDQRILLDTVKYWVEIIDEEGIELIEQRRLD